LKLQSHQKRKKGRKKERKERKEEREERKEGRKEGRKDEKGSNPNCKIKKGYKLPFNRIKIKRMVKTIKR
jgi:hypothetical protein